VSGNTQLPPHEERRGPTGAYLVGDETVLCGQANKRLKIPLRHVQVRETLFWVGVAQFEMGQVVRDQQIPREREREGEKIAYAREGEKEAEEQATIRKRGISM
jgi:hypothetical protein